jgi:hypothetical protein
LTPAPNLKEVLLSTPSFLNPQLSDFTQALKSFVHRIDMKTLASVAKYTFNLALLGHRQQAAETTSALGPVMPMLSGAPGVNWSFHSVIYQ